MLVRGVGRRNRRGKFEVLTHVLSGKESIPMVTYRTERSGNLMEVMASQIVIPRETRALLHLPGIKRGIGPATNVRPAGAHADTKTITVEKQDDKESKDEVSYWVMGNPPLKAWGDA